MNEKGEERKKSTKDGLETNSSRSRGTKLQLQPKRIAKVTLVNISCSLSQRHEKSPNEESPNEKSPNEESPNEESPNEESPNENSTKLKNRP